MSEIEIDGVILTLQKLENSVCIGKVGTHALLLSDAVISTAKLQS